MTVFKTMSSMLVRGRTSNQKMDLSSLSVFFLEISSQTVCLSNRRNHGLEFYTTEVNCYSSDIFTSITGLPNYLLCISDGSVVNILYCTHREREEQHETREKKWQTEKEKKDKKKTKSERGKRKEKMRGERAIKWVRKYTEKRKQRKREKVKKYRRKK